MRTQPIKVAGVKCLMCGDIIWSRANHDFRWCSCHNCYVDGGPAILSPSDGKELNTRVGWSIKEKILDVVEIVEIPEGRNIRSFVIQDYNRHRDELGLIKDPSYTEDDLTAAIAQLMLLQK